MSATRIAGKPRGPGSFNVRSASTEAMYAVEWITSQTCFCSCLHFGLKNDCRHIHEVAALIESEPWPDRPPSTPESREAARARLLEIERALSR